MADSPKQIAEDICSHAKVPQSLMRDTLICLIEEAVEAERGNMEDAAQTPLPEVVETLRAAQGGGQGCVVGNGINRDSLTILDAGHGQKNTFFTVVHDGQHAFVHYQLPQGFMAFQVVDDAIGMIVNNYLADVYEKEDTKHGRSIVYVSHSAD